MTMTWFDWVLLVYLGLNTILLVSIVGRPRNPVTGGTAAAGVVIYLLIVTGMILTHGGSV